MPKTIKKSTSSQFTKKDFKALAALTSEIHTVHLNWWTSLETGNPIERSIEELLALVISELSECLEGERKDLMDDKVYHRKMAEVELADTVIRALDAIGGFKLIDFEKPKVDEYWCREINVAIFNYSDLFKTRSKPECLFTLMKAVTALSREEFEDRGYAAYVFIMIYAGVRTYAKLYGYDLNGAIKDKLEVNRHRADHKIEARKAANGKKF